MFKTQKFTDWRNFLLTGENKICYNKFIGAVKPRLFCVFLRKLKGCIADDLGQVLCIAKEKGVLCAQFCGIAKAIMAGGLLHHCQADGDLFFRNVGKNPFFGKSFAGEKHTVCPHRF